MAEALFSNVVKDVTDLSEYISLYNQGVAKQTASYINTNLLYSISYEMFKDYNELLYISCKNVEFIAPSAFMNCPKLSYINIKAFSSTIYANTFCNCSNLKTIECDTPLDIANGMGAFSNCGSLEQINIRVAQYINTYTFYNCKSLRMVNISYLANYGIGYSYRSIMSYAFYGCSNLTDIDLSMFTDISDSAFYGCNKLQEIQCNSLITIRPYAFYDCSNLFQVIGGNIKSIGSSAFANCYRLEEIILDNVEYIGAYAFSSCSNLIKSDLNLTKLASDGLGAGAFAKTIHPSLINSIVVKNVTDLYDRVFQVYSDVDLTANRNWISSVEFDDVTHIHTDALQIPILNLSLSNCILVESNALFGYYTTKYNRGGSPSYSYYKTTINSPRYINLPECTNFGSRNINGGTIEFLSLPKATGWAVKSGLYDIFQQLYSSGWGDSMTFSYRNYNSYRISTLNLTKCLIKEWTGSSFISYASRWFSNLTTLGIAAESQPRMAVFGYWCSSYFSKISSLNIGVTDYNMYVLLNFTSEYSSLNVTIRDTTSSNAAYLYFSCSALADIGKINLTNVKRLSGAFYAPQTLKSVNFDNVTYTLGSENGFSLCGNSNTYISYLSFNKLSATDNGIHCDDWAALETIDFNALTLYSSSSRYTSKKFIFKNCPSLKNIHINSYEGSIYINLHNISTNISGLSFPNCHALGLYSIDNTPLEWLSLDGIINFNGSSSQSIHDMVYISGSYTPLNSIYLKKCTSVNDTQFGTSITIQVKDWYLPVCTHFYLSNNTSPEHIYAPLCEYIAGYYPNLETLSINYSNIYGIGIVAPLNNTHNIAVDYRSYATSLCCIIKTSDYIDTLIVNSLGEHEEFEAYTSYIVPPNIINGVTSSVVSINVASVKCNRILTIKPVRKTGYYWLSTISSRCRYGPYNNIMYYEGASITIPYSGSYIYANNIITLKTTGGSININATIYTPLLVIDHPGSSVLCHISQYGSIVRYNSSAPPMVKVPYAAYENYKSAWSSYNLSIVPI